MAKKGDTQNTDAGNYIIGAGITGLLAGYLLKDYKIISREENIGGQLKATFQLGPRFVRYNKDFVKILKKLKIKFLVKHVKIGYFNGTEILDEPTEEMKLKYAQYTRKHNALQQSFMNDGLNKMKILKFDMDLFIDKLKRSLKDRITNSNATDIDLNKKIIMLDNDTYLNYDKIVSTIHYSDFCNLVGEKDNFTYGDIFFFLVDNNVIPYDSKHYAFIYIISDDIPFNRVTKIKIGSVLEAPRPLTKQQMEQFGVKQYYILKNCKLKGEYKIIPIQNVTFLGRYATLENETRIHNIVERIAEIKKGEN